VSLATPAGFYDHVRSGLLGPTLSPGEISGCEAILKACAAWPLAWTAYGLATAYHETAHTMQPIKEHGGDAYFNRMYGPEGLRPHVAEALGNVHPGDGARFPGMGYAQATGRGNARKLTVALRQHGFPDIDLEQTPELLMRPDIAAFALVYGMASGLYTGRKLLDFLPLTKPATRAEFMAARRIINGQDKADLIADYAVEFQAALQAGGWQVAA
jgi:putative chitinase